MARHDQLSKIKSWICVPCKAGSHKECVDQLRFKAGLTSRGRVCSCDKCSIDMAQPSFDPNGTVPPPLIPPE